MIETIMSSYFFNYSSIYNTDILFLFNFMHYSSPYDISGSVYRFYVVASNHIGKSAASPVLSVVVGTPPGLTAQGGLMNNKIAPTITAIDATYLTPTWLMTSSAELGRWKVAKDYKLIIFICFFLFLLLSFMLHC